MNDQVKDMTKGSPVKLIISFSVPLMLGSIFQQLYIVTDSMIVGRGIGVTALAAIGAADWLNWMVLGIVMGFTQGFSILIAQCFGTGDYRRLRQTVAMSVILSALIAVVTLIVSQAGLMPVLRFLNTPEETIDASCLYLRVLFIGIPAVTAYNIMSSVLRALGNSKAPLMAMVVASVINIVLDLFFVVGLKTGVEGAAAATAIAQVFSAVYCYLAIRKISILRFEKEDWNVDVICMKELMRLSTPIALQNGIIAIGGLAVQSVLNGIGIIYMAGFTATNKLYGLLELAAVSYGYAISTYMGQNLGARDLARIKKGIKSAVVMAVITSVLISIVMLLFGRSIVALFITGEESQAEAVTAVAFHYLSIMAYLLSVLYLLHLYRSALQGLGNTVVPMISGIVELAMRILAALLLPKLIGDEGIFYAEIAAWTGAAILLVIGYYIQERKVAVLLQDRLQES